MNDQPQGSASQRLFRDLSQLSAAEEFFEYFALPYDRHVVNVNRLHILKRFRQYLADALDGAPASAEDLRALCAALLQKSHEDFAQSNARVEKVFRVFQDQTPQVAVKTILRGGAPRIKGE